MTMSPQGRDTAQNADMSKMVLPGITGPSSQNPVEEKEKHITFASPSHLAEKFPDSPGKASTAAPETEREVSPSPFQIESTAEASQPSSPVRSNQSPAKQEDPVSAASSPVAASSPEAAPSPVEDSSQLAAPSPRARKTPSPLAAKKEAAAFSPVAAGYTAAQFVHQDSWTPEEHRERQSAIQKVFGDDRVNDHAGQRVMGVRKRVESESPGRSLRDVCVPGLQVSQDGQRFEDAFAPHKFESFKEKKHAEIVASRAEYAGMGFNGRLMKNVESQQAINKVRKSMENVAESQNTEAPAMSGRVGKDKAPAGYRSARRSVDAKRVSTLLGLKQDSFRDSDKIDYTKYEVQAMNKGPPRGLSKLQRIDKHREYRQGLPSVVRTWNNKETSSVPPAGCSMHGKGIPKHHQDVKSTIKYGAVPYDPDRNDRIQLAQGEDFSKKLVEFQESGAAGRGRQSTVFDKLRTVPVAKNIVPYDDGSKFVEKGLRRAHSAFLLDEVTDGAAGNVGGKGHNIGRESTWNSFKKVLPPSGEGTPTSARRPPFTDRLKHSATEGFAGMVKDRPHHMISRHAQLKEHFIVPYSDEPYRSHRQNTPTRIGGAAGCSNTSIERKKEHIVPYDSRAQSPGNKKLFGEDTIGLLKESAGNIRGEGHHMESVKNKMAAHHVVPYEEKNVEYRGVRRNSKMDMYKYDEHVFVKKDHVKSTERGVNPIKGAVPYQSRGPIQSKKQFAHETSHMQGGGSIVPYENTEEIRSRRMQTKPHVSEKQYQDRNVRYGGVFRPIDSPLTFKHKEHVKSAAPVEAISAGSRPSYDLRGGKRTYQTKAVTGYAVPYEAQNRQTTGRKMMFDDCTEGAVGRRNRHNSAIEQRGPSQMASRPSTFASNGMTDVLKPLVAHMQDY